MIINHIFLYTSHVLKYKNCLSSCAHRLYIFITCAHK